MTIQSWDLYRIKVEIIVEHLKDKHSVDFNHRASLSEDEYLEEHFPELLKDMEDRNLIFEGDFRRKGLYLGAKGKTRIERGRKLLKDALKFCEEKSIPIAKVFDFNHNGEGEWRICCPTAEQLAYLKFERWIRIIEGLANKTLLQGNMIDEASLDEVLKDIRETIIEGQKAREEKREKQKVEVEVTTETGNVEDVDEE